MSYLVLFLIAISPFAAAHIHCQRQNRRSEQRKAVQALYTWRRLEHGRHCGASNCPCKRTHHYLPYP